MNDVTVYEPKAFEMSVIQVKEQIAKIQSLMSECMKENEHYGPSFPGDTKKNLLKPGADKLCFMFRLRPEFELQSVDLPNLHREVRTICRIFHIETGVKIAEGVGSCSTMEKKYRYRDDGDYEILDDPIPEDSKERKSEYRKQGLGMKKVNGAWCWVRFKGENKIENPDIADTYNTVLKQSKKRAYVDAVITSCAASDIFAQDADELPKGDEDEHEKTEGPKTEKKPPKTEKPLSPLAQKARGIKNELIALGSAKHPNSEEYVFSEEQRKTIKDQIEKVNATAKERKSWIDDDIGFLNDALGVWKKKLSETASTEKPAQSLAQEALEDDIDAAAEEGFDEGFEDQAAELDIF